MENSICVYLWHNLHFLVSKVDNNLSRSIISFSALSLWKQNKYRPFRLRFLCRLFLTWLLKIFIKFIYAKECSSNLAATTSVVPTRSSVNEKREFVIWVAVERELTLWPHWEEYERTSPRTISHYENYTVVTFNT